MDHIKNTIVTDKSLLEACKSEMERGPIMHHPFLLRFEREVLSRDQLAMFIGQWYKTAKAHREAFPALIGNVKDDDLRFELIDILNEEYGYGDRTRIHARLLERVVEALGLAVAEVKEMRTLSAIECFGRRISEVWTRGDHAEAIGLHFALEYLATAFQQHFALGLAKYTFLSPRDREYFDLHAEAEIRHVAFSEAGFLRYTDKPNNRRLLLSGVRTAERLLGAVWDQFNELIFSSAPVRATKLVKHASV